MGCCFGCCNPQYARLVESIYPVRDTTESAQRAKENKLFQYAIRNPEKLEKIGHYLGRMAKGCLKSRRRDIHVAVVVVRMTENLMNIQTQGRQAIVELAMQLVQRLLELRDVPFQALGAHAFVRTTRFFDSAGITASSRWDMDSLLSHFCAMCHPNQDSQQHMILSRISGLLGNLYMASVDDYV